MTLTAPLLGAGLTDALVSDLCPSIHSARGEPRFLYSYPLGLKALLLRVLSAFGVIARAVYETARGVGGLGLVRLELPRGPLGSPNVSLFCFIPVEIIYLS